MRYSVAPRGLFAGANIRLILKFRKCFPYFFPFLFLCQISGESSKITLSDYYCFSKVIYTVGYSGIEGYRFSIINFVSLMSSNSRVEEEEVSSTGVRVMFSPLIA